MTLYTLSLLLTFGAAVAFLGWLIVRGGTMKEAPAPPEPAKAKRVYIRGLCVYCGEAVVLRADGEPHARFHSCPGMTATVTTWPPAPPEVQP